MTECFELGVFEELRSLFDRLPDSFLEAAAISRLQKLWNQRLWEQPV